MKFILQCCLAGLCLVLGEGNSFGAEGLKQPVWSVDLSTFGRQAIETQQLLNPFHHDSGVAFLDDGTPVVYFMVRPGSPSLSVRDETGQFQFRAVFLDPGNGSKHKEQDWPAPPLAVAFLPAVQNRFIVRAGRRLQLFSRDMNLVNEIRLPEEGQYEDQRLKIDPSGSVLWFFRFNYHGKPTASIERFDAQSLLTLGSDQDTTLMLNLSVSDGGITELYPRGDPKVVIRGTNGEWSQILGRQKNQLCVGEPAFVSNSKLLVAGCGHVLLVDALGTILLDEKFDKSWHVESSVAISRNGKFVAVSLMKTKGGAFDTSVHRATTKLIVYDLEKQKHIAEIEVAPPPRNSYAFAISPDGESLAVLTDSALQMYRLSK
jgi:hypothetical protein